MFENIHENLYSHTIKISNYIDKSVIEVELPSRRRSMRAK